MRFIKRLICFIMIFVSIGAFSACSKSDNSADQPEINQGGGNEGGQTNYVSYTANEIIVLGSEFVFDFFESVDEGGFGKPVEDMNLLKMKVLFLNASKMINEVSNLDNLVSGYPLMGNEVDLSDDLSGPNSVKRFNFAFMAEDQDGNSNVKIRIVFGYNGVSETYGYDYYDFLIQTNKKNNTISCDILIERSEIFGDNDSTGKYFCAELDGNINAGVDANYHCYYFERVEEILENEQANFNNIRNLEQSKFDGITKTYIDTTETTKALMKDSSEQSELVRVVVGRLGQRKRMMFNGGVMGIRADLSENLIEYVNGQVEII